MSLLLYSSYLIEMHYTWQMLGWTGQSLRETTGTIYYTREMKEKGNKTSTTLPQCLTAASYISRGGGHEKVAQAAIHLWWHVYFYLHFLSGYSSIISFATSRVAMVSGACVLLHILHMIIIWPHLMALILGGSTLFFLHMATDAEGNHQSLERNFNDIYPGLESELLPCLFITRCYIDHK